MSRSPSIGNRHSVVRNVGQGQRCSTTLAGAENWLRAQAVSGSKKIFLFNLNRQLGKQSEALSMEKMYVERVQQVFDGLHSANTHLIVDERSQYHLQAACLVLAAYRVLTDQLNIPSDQVIKILQQCMGDSDSVGERAVRYSLQMCSKLMFRDNFASLTATARQMADVDLGKAFDVSHEESENLQISRVSGCFYNSFFVKHGAPELTAPIFCKAEEMLFEKASGLTREQLRTGDVTFHLRSTLAEGGDQCLFEVKRHRTTGDGRSADPT